MTSTTSIEYVRCGCGAIAEFHEPIAEITLEIGATEHKREIELPSPMCEECLKTYAAEVAQPIAAQAQLDAVQGEYIRQFEEVFKKGTYPVVCAGCKGFVFRWLRAAIDGSDHENICAHCFYLRHRDALLRKVADIPDHSVRHAAILKCLAEARQARDVAFNAIWGPYDASGIDPELMQERMRSLTGLNDT